MKMKFSHFVSLAAAGFALISFPARANLEVSASVNIQATADFYTPLGSAGVWVDVPSYGRCWRPNGVEVSWHPYCNGQWVWTDCGWYWESDEPWAWACYHYGNWVFQPAMGWVWVPGIEWAPAWVSWRVGPGYIGWAALGPRGVVYEGPQFVFVRGSAFGGRIQRSDVIINNVTVINNTKVVNNVHQQTREVGGTKRTVVVNEGPGLAAVQKESGKSFKSVPIQQAAGQTRVPANVARHSAEHPQNTPSPQNQVKENKARAVNEPVAAPRTSNVAQEPKKSQPPASVHPSRPGENREPTTRWWNPFGRSKKAPAQSPANTSKSAPEKSPSSPSPGVSPGKTPLGPQPSREPANPNPGPGGREGEQHEGHGPK